MKVVGLILVGIYLSVQSQMPGGDVIIEDKKLANLEKDDANFAVMKKYTNLILNRNCKIQVGETMSASYHVVEGINYTVVFSTSLGPLKIVSLAVLWMKQISVSSISFTDLGATGEVNPGVQDFSVSDIMLKQYSQLLAKNDEKYEISKLRKLCDKIYDDKKSSSSKTPAIQLDSKASPTPVPRNLQTTPQQNQIELRQQDKRSFTAAQSDQINTQ